MEWKFKEYIITDDSSKANPQIVHKLLSTTYWASDRPLGKVKKSIENSICFSALKHGRQIGFARVVTDYATFSWIADLVIHEDHRRKGLADKIMQIIQEHPDIPASVQLLRTKDAHKLYEKFGFKIGECMSK